MPDRPLAAARAPFPVSIVAAAILGLSLGDAARPVERQLGARLAVGTIDLYRAGVSPLLDRSDLARCRFDPSCSLYGREAISRYGLPRGGILTAGRVLRCHPWSRGGHDPVP